MSMYVSQDFVLTGLLCAVKNDFSENISWVGQMGLLFSELCTAIRSNVLVAIEQLDSCEVSYPVDWAIRLWTALA